MPSRPLAVAPFLRPRNSVSQVMQRVLLALCPATLAYIWFFGPGIIVNITIAVATCVGSEMLMLRMRGRPTTETLGDLSAVVTAVLLAFCLPPLTPWWITACGSAFAIVFAKQLYGGLGFNPFNPAMAGYAVVLISFPVEMTRWLPPRALAESTPGVLASLAAILTGNAPDGIGWDGLTMATPLDLVKTEVARLQTMPEIRADAIFGDFAGRGWEWIANWIAVGGVWLIYKGVIRWHIPVAVLASLGLCAFAFWIADPGKFASPGFHIFGGAAMLGAFFIATDPVSAATTPLGRVIFGAGVGILTYVIRTWGGYPDGIAFAVLIMNMGVPLIDRYTRPRVYGDAV